MGKLATRRCHGLAAVVGEPSSVSALGAVSRGASRAAIAKPMTTAIKPSAADSSADPGQARVAARVARLTR